MVFHGHFIIKKLFISLHPFLNYCLTKSISLNNKLIILYVFLVTVIISCSDMRYDLNDAFSKPVSFDLDSIRSRGKLIAVTDYNSINYLFTKVNRWGFIMNF